MLSPEQREGRVKHRNPPLQNSWEQQTLGSETLGKGFRATQKKKKEIVQFTLLCKWLRDILISCCWLCPPPHQHAGIECINTLNNLKHGLIVQEIGVPTRQRHRTDSNNWISFEAESWSSECEDVNIKRTFIPACSDKWYEAPS